MTPDTHQTDYYILLRRLAPLLRTRRPHVTFWSRVTLLWRNDQLTWDHTL